MAVNMRLKDKEQEAIEVASLKINKILIEKGIQPIGTAGIAHLLLQAGIDLAENDPEAVGNLYYRK